MKSTGIKDINGNDIMFGVYAKITHKYGKPFDFIGLVIDWGERIVVIDETDTRIDINRDMEGQKIIVLSKEEYFQEK